MEGVNWPDGGHPLQACLAGEYGLSVEQAEYIGAGVEGHVWRIRVAGGSVFCAKWFHRLAPSEVARRATLKHHLEEAGLPFPRLYPTVGGTQVATLNDRGLEVCEWVDGDVPTTMSPEAGHLAGMVLARVHVILHTFSEGKGANNKPPWQSAARAIAETTAMLDRINALGRKSELDDEIRKALIRRLKLLARMDTLISRVPPLNRQIVHGDYCRANLLFRQETLVGVIDMMALFVSPVWELSRIAFEPQTVVQRADWVGVAAATVRGYRSVCEPPQLSALVKVAALYHLSSTWGIDGRYGDAGQVLDTGAEDYFLNRQATARLLIENLPEVERVVSPTLG